MHNPVSRGFLMSISVSLLSIGWEFTLQIFKLKPPRGTAICIWSRKYFKIKFLYTTGNNVIHEDQKTSFTGWSSFNFDKSYLIRLAGLSHCLGGRGQKTRNITLGYSTANLAFIFAKSLTRRGQHYFSQIPQVVVGIPLLCAKFSRRVNPYFFRSPS